jgi:hypothetical protein
MAKLDYPKRGLLDRLIDKSRGPIGGSGRGERFTKLRYAATRLLIACYCIDFQEVVSRRFTFQIGSVYALLRAS